MLPLRGYTVVPLLVATLNGGHASHKKILAGTTVSAFTYTKKIVSCQRPPF